MAKEGLVEYKEAKKGSNPVIVKINRENKLYDKWEPTITKVRSKDNDEEDGKKKGEDFNMVVDIQELYKPRGNVMKIFGEGGDKNYYTIDQCRDLLNKYVQQQCESDKNKKNLVKLDPYLRHLFPPEEVEAYAPVQEGYEDLPR